MGGHDTYKEKILEWFFNQPSIISDGVITCLPQIPIKNSLAELPSQVEVEKLIRRMSSGKAPGSDSIPVEVYTTDVPQLIE